MPKTKKKPVTKKAKRRRRPGLTGTAKERIGRCAVRIHGEVKKGHKPSMKFPIRSLSNVAYDPKDGYFQLLGHVSERTLSVNTVKTFAQSVRMMAESKKLIETNDIASKREMYYVAKSWNECRFDEQVESDTVMDDIEAMFETNREQLRFIPAEHGGQVAGRLTVIDRDPSTKKSIRIDCAAQGSGAWSVPANVEHLKFETKAKFVLVVETAALFNRLTHHAYWKKTNCVLVAMGGVPTRACRRFLRRLSDSKRIPVYVFTDGDPYGYTNIYRTLKVGSGNAAHINEFFCVPKARFLGVTPQDIIDFDLKNATHPLQKVDIKRAKDALRNDPFVKHHRPWQKAFRQMLKMGVRVEQQAFAKHGLNFVIDKYLPRKLRNAKKFLP